MLKDLFYFSYNSDAMWRCGKWIPRHDEDEDPIDAVFLLQQIVSMNLRICMQASLECINPDYVRMYMYASL
jgi:hypothetical protein